MDFVEVLPDAQDPLLQRLQMKHAELRVKQVMELKKTLEIEHSAMSKKIHKLPTTLDLVSDEISFTLNEIAVRCEEYAVPHVGQLLKDVHTMMNQQLREAYRHVEAGYRSAFHKMEEANEVQYRQQKSASSLGVSPQKPDKSPPHQAPANVECPPMAKGKNGKRGTGMKGTSEVRVLSVTEAMSATTGLFAESIAVSLRCEVVRIYLYDEYGNLNCCARFPFSATKGDPLAGTNLELILAKEVHRTVCQSCIAVNGRKRQEITMIERDRKEADEEIEQSGWKAMNSCLIFPVISNERGKQTHGMIHAMNKQGTSVNLVGEFDETDENFLFTAACLLGCLLSRYPGKCFMRPVGNLIHQHLGLHPVHGNDTSFLPQLIEDEVEDAAIAGNKALQMRPRVLVHRAPINVIYQARAERRKTRKLEVLHMVDRALSSVEFDLNALEELWRVGHEENRIMYEHCQHTNEQLNTLQVLLQNVLDGIGASRNMGTLEEVRRYLRALELHARQENTLQIKELISKALLHSDIEEIPPQLKEEVKSGRLTLEEAIQMERRLEAVESKLKFGASPVPQVRIYSYNPQLRREQARFFNANAEKRERLFNYANMAGDGPGYKGKTVSAVTKEVNLNPSLRLCFGTTDYASRRPFRLQGGRSVSPR
ncbi:conserved protein, unknown function [Trypanosoma equiperdum]|uniref:GAF domain-containing protein n=3 Tax=Trypanozoon TaxID=39700 RepID=Q57ZZ5_TRYB2|nr:hypothetical protein, conserved [Trypanosoma brucei brucei TREU927]AAX80950.1 hypothetical protein, conserved [Trypanosoma brucei]AAZ10658.1 hypothetical protein, conserved [Trypanosoma brucei brucei TREU927]RHW73071.1 hypothetical protein DPX39_040009100 [Trypanosoma brucei equiperdum]SCU65909.1 conserved protein, unknown function [Trypanosoma equiperdum]